MADCYPMFAAFLWKEKITETQDILSCLNDVITANIEKYPILTPPNWECVVHSSYNNKDININNNAIVKIYEKYMGKFLNDFQLNIEEFRIQSLWYNAFLKNHFQEPHTHLPSDFSAVHYLDFDDNCHSPTTFINPNLLMSQAMNSLKPNFCKKLNYENLLHSCFFDDITLTDISQGDIVFFPSYLNHYVRPNKSNKRRITISFNIQHICNV